MAMRNAAGPKPQTLGRWKSQGLWGLSWKRKEPKSTQNCLRKRAKFNSHLNHLRFVFCFNFFVHGGFYFFLMRFSRGFFLRLFVPEMAFERMVKRQIQKLEEPALQCRDGNGDAVQTTVSSIKGLENVGTCYLKGFWNQVRQSKMMSCDILGAQRLFFFEL